MGERSFLQLVLCPTNCAEDLNALRELQSTNTAGVLSSASEGVLVYLITTQALHCDTDKYFEQYCTVQYLLAIGALAVMF